MATLVNMVKPKQIINKPEESVSEFISGLLFQYPNHLRTLQNHPGVVLCAAALRGEIDTPNPKNVVQLISGGGSGHEPSHAGWIGRGMLSAAVCGGIFASPSVSSILAAIRVLHDHSSSSSSSSSESETGGVLLIIKNYTGDRLNFGMAAEKAAQQGICVECVIVADDCAVPRSKGITGARGVAGTVLVHKIAGGAAAASGQKFNLLQVRDIARRAASRMGSMGFALESVTVPGSELKNDRLGASTIEIGLGIHGEAGLKQSHLLTAHKLAKELIESIQSFGRIQPANVNDDGTVEETIIPMMNPGDEVVLLVNNLGGSSNFEMSLLARSCVDILEGHPYRVKARRVLVGSYMTSFNMHGASLTILNVQDQPDLLEYLDSPTDAPAWTSLDVWDHTDHVRPSSVPVPEVIMNIQTSASDVQLQLPTVVEVKDFAYRSQSLMLSAVKSLSASEYLLTQYDTVVGDGDCGITMERGAVEVRYRISNGTLKTDHPVTLFSSLADALSASMGGTSGILLELMFRKMSSTLLLSRRLDQSIGVAELCFAFAEGVEAVSLYGGAKVGSRTMLDALVPAALTLVRTQSLHDAAVAARAGAEGTALMKAASAGRSNYLSGEILYGTPDPGACAVAIVLEALSRPSTNQLT